jgi:HEPN domain-containing protein
MPRERFEPDDPREWVARARGNIVIARNLVPGVELEDLCFNAQQAAEKALKAVLLKLGVDFPYTHDLGRLLTLITRERGAASADVADAHELTRYAVIARYPLPPDEVISQEHYERALEIAEAVVRWAEDEIGE